jgi:quinol monooxygenase YgiN
MKLVSPDRCLGISLWKDRESATRYHDSTYPKVLEKLQPVIEGKPRVENYEVTPSTVTA